MSVPCELERLAALLSDAGFLAADEEAGELLECAGADPDRLESLVRRRLTGEPLAWITGSVSFCGLTIHVEPGVYVPRRHSEELARRAARRLPAHGAAVDPCTGTGALARTLMGSRPGARSRRPWRASRSRPGELLPPRAQALDAA